MKNIISEELNKFRINEALIKIPKIPNTINFFHGGNLDNIDDFISQKKGRYEYGVGLYLINHYETALKYSKGARKLYIVSVEIGTDLEKTLIPKDKILTFIKYFIVGTKKKMVTERILKYEKEDGMIPAYIMNNVILNEEAISSSNGKHLMEFYVENGIDYNLISNPFGWGETMMVLFNMKKIKKIIRINGGDKLESYDL